MLNKNAKKLREANGLSQIELGRTYSYGPSVVWLCIKW